MEAALGARLHVEGVEINEYDRDGIFDVELLSACADRSAACATRLSSVALEYMSAV